MPAHSPHKSLAQGSSGNRCLVFGEDPLRPASGKALRVSSAFRKPSILVGWVGGGKGSRYPFLGMSAATKRRSRKGRRIHDTHSSWNLFFVAWSHSPQGEQRTVGSIVRDPSSAQTRRPFHSLMMVAGTVAFLFVYVVGVAGAPSLPTCMRHGDPVELV